MLKNKIALVTGASSGIGRAVALVWAREGAKVVVSDIHADGGQETVELVRAQGGDALFVAADVGKPEDAKMLVERTVAHYGRLDVACNNAGIAGPSAPTAFAISTTCAMKATSMRRPMPRPANMVRMGPVPASRRRWPLRCRPPVAGTASGRDAVPGPCARRPWRLGRSRHDRMLRPCTRNSSA